MALCTANFEKGINGANILVADAGSDTPWDVRSVTGGSLTYDNTHIHSGILAAKLVYNGTSAATDMQWTTSFGTQTDHYGREYFYATSNPSTNNADAIIKYTTTASPTNSAGWGINSSGIISVGDSNNGSTSGTVPIALNQWIRIEWHLFNDNSVGLVEAKLFNIAESVTPTETITRSGVITGTSSTSAIIGCVNTSDTAFTFWFDDLIVGANSYPGPIPIPNANTIFRGGRGSAW